jgi:hypothetical protein
MMGEAHTHMVLGSIFLEGPRTNRFPMATTFVDQSVAQQAEGNVEEAFSQGNYFWYAVRGIDRTRQTVINMKSAGGWTKSRPFWAKTLGRVCVCVCVCVCVRV